MYLLIAHKPTDVRYWRGHYEGYVSGDFEIANYLSKDETIKELAKYFFKNATEDGCAYALYLYKEGRRLLEDGDVYPDAINGNPHPYDSLEYWAEDEHLEKLSEEDEDDAEDILKQAKAICQEQLDEHNRKVKAAERAAENLEHRKKQFEKLKEEFEPGT
jgi:hypothetical protein